MGKLGKTLIESISAEPTKEIKIKVSKKTSLKESKDEKDEAIWKLIDKYEAGEISKEEVKNEVEKLNNGNKEEVDADLELIFNESEEINAPEDNVCRVKDCLDDVDLISALEGNTLKIEDQFDWERVKEVASEFSQSQGFYGRLLRDMIELEEAYGSAESIEYPVYM